MQAVVERVIRSFSLKQLMTHEDSGVMHGAIQDDAAQFASLLLANYRDRLAQRCRRNDTQPQD
ncbi:hypothetical protein [Tardiphaga sp.]|uniref:hypothetical protein n=1 Tax=Tardiphaga sp. TaxID=1926292 RepID=UPI00260177A0|nr:hypothetical protein [Tardiphaga sp.]MDB5617400.1 hypothetical protein [Tardiphaga sp.]